MKQPRRKRLIRTAAFGKVRFLTFSCERRLPLLSNPLIAHLFVKQLHRARERWGIQLFAWVVMPEHVHLLLSPTGPPNDARADLTVRVLWFIKKSVAQRVIARWKEIDARILADISQHAAGRPRFGQKGGGFDRCVRDTDELMHEIRYIHHNPVERGLCQSPTDWEFSSARWWARSSGEPGHDPLIECDAPPGNGWESWKGWR
ncbi:MAG: transposase [Phycisphaeraceae bacterium]|nr:transposase [Phycisphaeraceae bacterium]